MIGNEYQQNARISEDTVAQTVSRDPNKHFSNGATMPARNDPVGAFVDYPPVKVASAATGPLAGLTLAVKDLYDVSGRRVAELARGVRPAGEYRLDWRAGPSAVQASGVFFIRASLGGRTLIRRVVLLK